jgi:transposase-like protein
MAKVKKAKRKVKRYSASEKKAILDFITKQGRGGQTKAVAKFGVTAATIASWRNKDGGSGVKTAKGASKELRAVEELARLIKEISTVEARLEKLKKSYQKAKAKL